jgi:hypothetical protein
VATITEFTFEDADGNEPDTFTTQDYAEAVEHARRGHLRVIANEYEWS